MMPNDRLGQGSFEDLDLQAADNFARACAAAGVRQIVYLGGLLPAATPSAELSRHLRSRAEVERALADHGVPVTVLRAGLILGPGGSSMEILLRIARRLPVMICPRWTNSPTQPIVLDDVLDLLVWVVGRGDVYGQTFDIGGPDVLTYRRLMEMTGEDLGRRPRTLSVPVITPRLSRLWVRLVTGAPKALVQPLVESLSHSMVAGDRRLQDAASVPGRPLRPALRAAIAYDARARPPRAFQATVPAVPIVRSVQRLPAWCDDARRVVEEYFRWLGRWTAPLLQVSRSAEGRYDVRLRSGGLLMRFTADSSSWRADRAVLDVAGGWLVGEPRQGRFEFRYVLAGEFLLCSVHGFAPRLWWPLYVVTQAPLHLLVMHRFARHLARLAEPGAAA